VIGLFGKAAPRSTRQLKRLFDPAGTGGGLALPCRPRAIRAAERDQLQANKVYSTCKAQEANGVNLQYSRVWRIVPNQRIDVGDVVGKFQYREYPTWQEEGDDGGERMPSPSSSPLSHSRPGVVSVRRGNDGGFGFTIYPGGGDDDTVRYLDETQIVVGRVLEGMDVVDELNSEVPIIKSSTKFGGGGDGGSSNAPLRGCTYGGSNLYCNENKPLVKLTLSETGVL